MNLYKSKGFLLLILVAVFILGLGIYGITHEPYALAHIEIADTQAKQQQGLSGRREVPSDYGMLFIFPEKAFYQFWMKDMLVPIDIIWLSDDGTIVGIEHSVEPATYPNTFSPKLPVRYVLEVRAGEARARGWDVGTILNLPIP